MLTQLHSYKLVVLVICCCWILPLKSISQQRHTHYENDYDTSCIRFKGTKPTIRLQRSKNVTPTAKTTLAGKEIYWPNDLTNTPEVSLDRSYQTTNFIIFWGNKAGLNPKEASDPVLRFDPVDVGNQLEFLYDKYVNQFRWLDDSTGNISRYKMIIIINETWDNGKWKGYAFGGSYDDIIGAMWVAPAAAGPRSLGLSHELAHSFQAQTIAENRDVGFNDEASGFFWEKHAEYVVSRTYPDIYQNGARMLHFVGGHYHFNSVRKHYEDINLLHFLEDRYGPEINFRVWREANSVTDENPLEVYRRILNLSPTAFADLIGAYQQKVVFFDYLQEYGDEVRKFVWEGELEKTYVPRHFTLLEPQGDNIYKVLPAMSPQDYARNIVQLNATDAINTDGELCMNFYGYPNGSAGGVSFRFSFIATSDKGETLRYSAVHAANENQEVQVTFRVNPNEKVYLVVTAIPTVHHRYAWEIGFPKTYRYPWQVQLSGAIPFVDHHDGVDGAPHPNGGGFVASTATVAPSVYVGPNATVLGNSILNDNVRLEDQAVASNANLSGNIQLRDASIAINSIATGDIVVEDCGVIWWLGDVKGNMRIGGDGSAKPDCTQGYYRQEPHPNNGRTLCDGLTSHPSNDDINPVPQPRVFTTEICEEGTCELTIANIATEAQLQTSHVSPWESLPSITNGIIPQNSQDRTGGAYGNWDGEANYNTWNWVELSWDTIVDINQVDVYWFDDNGGIKIPSEANVSYWNSKEWVDIGIISTISDAWNTINGLSIKTTKIRYNMISERATGILEVNVYGSRTRSCNDGDACTVFDTLDEMCECKGVFLDSDNDSICDADDNTDGDCTLGTTMNIANQSQLQTSHVSPWENLPSITNGIIPQNSQDRTGGAYGNWDGEANYNTWNWVELSWDTIVDINQVDVYWFDDNGGIKIPNEANVSYWNSKEWVVIGDISTLPSAWNTINSLSIKTTKIRYQMISERATGILEVNVYGRTTSSCDDGDACTVYDTFNEQCECIGVFLDSDNDSICDADDDTDGNCSLGATCDDGDACTVNDVYDANCNCAGTFADADNDSICDADDDTDGNCSLGATCDDGDACTVNDVYDANCNCAGTFADADNDSICDADDDTDGNCSLGATCDDGDACTIDDTYGQNCRCQGIFMDSDNDSICDADDDTDGDCSLGVSCDDDDECTINDAYDANCNCTGELLDTNFNQICDLDEGILSTPDQGDDALQLKVRMYPNPTRGMVYLETKTLIDQITVYDLMGKKLQLASTQKQVDLSILPNGIYIIAIVKEHQRLFYKITKE